MEHSSPFLDPGHRVHRNWWTCVPALPSESESRWYWALRQSWFDHTTTHSFRDTAGNSRTVPAFFYELHENHLAAAIFQTWSALLPHTDWASSLIDVLGSPIDGKVSGIAWSYQVQSERDAGHAIADIAIHWEDSRQRVTTVIETKRPKGVPQKDGKDFGGLRYRMLPDLVNAGTRVDYVLLIDKRDEARFERERGSWLHEQGKPTPIVFWQDLVALQVDAITKSLPALYSVPPSAVDIVARSIVARAHHLGLESAYDDTLEDPVIQAKGTLKRYHQIRGMALPIKVEELLIGFDVVLGRSKFAWSWPLKKELTPSLPIPGWPWSHWRP